MNTTDRQAITDLFDKLSKVERQMPARDPDAEHLIGQAMASQPSAPYYMAQTIVVQEHALNTAQSRIEQLQADLQQARQAQQDSGFFSGLFGGGTAPRRPTTTARSMPQGAPGGFLSGAAQTAMGVAGGMLLANAIAGVFVGDAQASEVAADPEPDLGDDFGDDSDW